MELVNTAYGDQWPYTDAPRATIFVLVGMGIYRKKTTRRGEAPIVRTGHIRLMYPIAITVGAGIAGE